MGCDCNDCESGCGYNKGPICQSCGMPMAKQDEFGTNSDGSKSNDYCCFCFQDGNFNDGCTTAEQKSDHIARIVGKIKGTSENQLKDEAKKYLPLLKELKRWKG